MSRTIKGSKGPGYDYWGRRRKSATCGHGPDVKRQTNREERRTTCQRVKLGDTELMSNLRSNNE